MYRVVLIDDEPVALDELTRSIPWQEYNCEVVGTAQNGKDGLNLISRSRPDMMITDIAMKSVDGLRMIGGAKAEHPDLRVTVLTGSKDIEFAREAVKLGVDRYILKPLKKEEVEEAVLAMEANIDSAQAIKKSAILQEDKTDTAAAARIVKLAMEYIRTHYDRKLYLSDVADQAFVSQWYLSRLIHRETGRSFPDLLNSVRIGKAKELLEDPDMRIGYIAMKVGFSDPAHFARAFRRETGMSANEYRKKKTGPKWRAE